MGDYKKCKSTPNANLLLSSLRSVGYSEETAIADIIDNSISAEANIIKLNFDWSNKRIVIIDDGKGMTQKDLLESMRIGSSNPNDYRNKNDLGRFGMGMKTAAFSLGKKLTVITKKENKISNASWDLAKIEIDNEWNLYIEDQTSPIISFANEQIKEFDNGTVVIIDNLDRLVDLDNLNKSKERFYRIIRKIKKHIALVFHRFIEEDRLLIYVNNNLIKAYNPFLIENKATQELSTEIYDEKNVIIQPYILPHKTKFKSEEDYQKASGPKGWLNSQGFYVYRNRRLIIYGTWFERIRKEHSFNLVRIKLDMSSENDFDWKIDIKKSKAVPPVYLDDLINNIINITTEKSTKVYYSRGAYGKRKTNNDNLTFVWEQRKNSSGKYMFYLNKTHPLLYKIKAQLNEEGRKQLKSYLALIENYCPMIVSGLAKTIDNSNINNDLTIDKIDESTIIELVQTFKNVGFEKEEVIDVISGMDEYSYIKKEKIISLIGGIFND